MSTYQKPGGLSKKYAAQFQDSSMARAYLHREPYAPSIFPQLSRLAAGPHPRVLDLGCGTGDLTIGLAQFANQVDAVDVSETMLSEATRTHAQIKNISWICGEAEEVTLEGPYQLVTSAQSLHWMNWPKVADRLRRWLQPGAYFAVIARQYVDKEWWTPAFQSIIDRYTTNREFQKYELIDELNKSQLFQLHGDHWSEPVHFRQRVCDLVESFHSRNGFSRDRMSPEDADGFDREATAHLEKFSENGIISLKANSRVTWMTPK